MHATVCTACNHALYADKAYSRSSLEAIPTTRRQCTKTLYEGVEPLLAYGTPAPLHMSHAHDHTVQESNHHAHQLQLSQATVCLLSLPCPHTSHPPFNLTHLHTHLTTSVHVQPILPALLLYCRPADGEPQVLIESLALIQWVEDYFGGQVRAHVGLGSIRHKETEMGCDPTCMQQTHVHALYLM